jgi:thymidylate kinase
LSALALGYHWLDHALGYATRIRPALVRSAVVVMERGYHDLLVDPRRYRIDFPRGPIHALGRLLPKPDLTVLLLGDPTVLHQRKPELEPEEIARQIERWGSIAPRLGRVAVVDAAGSPDDVMAKVLDAVLDARSATLAGPMGPSR